MALSRKVGAFMIEIITSQVGRASLIELNGRVDSMSSGMLRETLMEQVDDGRQHLVLDMADVTYLSAAGLRVLKEVYDREGELRIARPSQRVREVLQMTGLDALFSVFDTRTRALHTIVPVTNAHTHLELGWLGDSCPGVTGMDFIDWIVNRVDKRWDGLADADTVLQRAAEKGVRELVRAGTTMVGDISSSGASIGPLLEAGLSGIVYIELLGVDPAQNDARMKKVRDLVEKWRHKGGVEIIEPRREQIGVYGGKLEARVS